MQGRTTDRSELAMTMRRRPQTDQGDRELELGFGSVVSRRARRRLLNRDGTFNVRRRGLGFWESVSVYHALLEMTWPRFFLLSGLAYLALNMLFALAYAWLGVDSVVGGSGVTFAERVWEDFFFSVQTSSTLGYGNLSPNGVMANVLVTFEALTGLLTFGLISGLMFARFARPMPKVLFSEVAVVAPYQGGTAFQFRLINRRRTQISDLQVRVIFVRRHEDGTGREYDQLDLERSRVAFFPLSWTVVHPVGEDSPLHGLAMEDLTACESEFLVLLQGFDETFSQTVHVRTSYRAEEVVFGARFANMFDREDQEQGKVSVDLRKLHDVERTSP
jgi:inward rectifier potassium channel